jgi:DNA repair protein RecN (Recombination protein N)
MLESLHISNYALIDSIDIEFNKGLNIITGETGAGKSIILGALGLLLGGRADSRTIARSDSKSVIEAKFNVACNTTLSTYCRENDIEWDEEQMILRRELSPSGRSRAFINDSPVTLTAMQQVGRMLIDIHSQHQNQLLSEPQFQLRIIDAIAGNGERLETYAGLYADLKSAMRRFKSTKSALVRDRDNAEFMEFQLQQLDELDPKAGELQELETELETMSSQTELRAYLTEASETISEGHTSILSQLRKLQDTCAEIENLFSDDDRINERLEAVGIELNDIAETITDLNSETATASQEDIDFVEKRIDRIRTLMRKHSVDSDAELAAIRENLRSRLDALADSKNVLTELEHEVRSAHKRALEAAREISTHRQQAAEKFAATLTETAMPLGMKNLRCVIDVAKSDLGPDGIDNVEFRFAFNKSQEPIPISGAASGGEISRLMLSVKSIVASLFELPTIIFDEVDTGVSGDVASRMGRMMSQMSDNMQVITITHLPQVASRGSSHFKVYKEDDETSTHTNIIRLTPEQRIGELALMLSGDPNNAAARATATTLLTQK